jgi:Cu+-exporting ATPase
MGSFIGSAKLVGQDESGPSHAVVRGNHVMGKGDLVGIVRAWRLSGATMGSVRQTLFVALIHNVTGVPIAAGILYPWFGLLLSPMIARAAMTTSSVWVS